MLECIVLSFGLFILLLPVILFAALFRFISLTWSIFSIVILAAPVFIILLLITAVRLSAGFRVIALAATAVINLSHDIVGWRLHIRVEKVFHDGIILFETQTVVEPQSFRKGDCTDTVVG